MRKQALSRPRPGLRFLESKARLLYKRPLGYPIDYHLSHGLNLRLVAPAVTHRVAIEHTHLPEERRGLADLPILLQQPTPLFDPVSRSLAASCLRDPDDEEPGINRERKTTPCLSADVNCAWRLSN